MFLSKRHPTHLEEKSPCQINQHSTSIGTRKMWENKGFFLLSGYSQSSTGVFVQTFSLGFVLSQIANKLNVEIQTLAKNKSCCCSPWHKMDYAYPHRKRSHNTTNICQSMSHCFLQQDYKVNGNLFVSVITWQLYNFVRSITTTLHSMGP